MFKAIHNGEIFTTYMECNKCLHSLVRNAPVSDHSVMTVNRTGHTGYVFCQGAASVCQTLNIQSLPPTATPNLTHSGT